MLTLKDCCKRCKNLHLECKCGKCHEENKLDDEYCLAYYKETGKKGRCAMEEIRLCPTLMEFRSVYFIV